MKKHIIALLMAFTLVLSVTACGTQPTTEANITTNTVTDEPSSTPDTDNVQTEISSEQTVSDEESNSISEPNPTPESDAAPEPDPTTKPDSFDALETNVLKDVKDCITGLTTEMEALSAEIDTFQKYTNNADKVESFYIKTCTESTRLSICLMEHAVTYAEFIINSNDDFDDKYDNLDELYDCIYDDAGDEFYDGIYDGVLDEMYEVFYDGLLDDAYDSVPYDKWLDARSNEYDWWLDARSDAYEIWLDTRSDIYEFWLDLRSATFTKDTDEVNEIIADFVADIEDLKTDLQE